MKKLILVILIIVSFIVFSQDDLKKAPSFRLENTDGLYTELDSLITKGPVLVNFWASWCKPCKEELPEFDKLAKEFSENGLKVALITIDKPAAVQKAKNFLKTKGIGLELLKDCSMSVFKSFGGSGSVPYTFLISKEKSIVYRKKGQINYKELHDEVKKLFK